LFVVMFLSLVYRSVRSLRQVTVTWCVIALKSVTAPFLSPRKQVLASHMDYDWITSMLTGR